MAHDGGLFSYITLLWTFPDLNMGLFVSVNGPAYETNAPYHNQVSVYYIADQLLDLDPWLNKTTACTFPQPWDNQTTAETNAKEAPVAIGNFTEYEGSYDFPLFSNIDVYSNYSNLLMNSNHIQGVLHPSSEKDRFLYEITYPWEFAPHDNTTKLTNVTFVRDEVTNAVTALTVQLEVNVTYVRKAAILDQPQKPEPPHVQIQVIENTKPGNLRYWPKQHNQIFNMHDKYN